MRSCKSFLCSTCSESRRSGSAVRGLVDDIRSPGHRHFGDQQLSRYPSAEIHESASLMRAIDCGPSLRSLQDSAPATASHPMRMDQRLGNWINALAVDRVGRTLRCKVTGYIVPYNIRYILRGQEL